MRVYLNKIHIEELRGGGVKVPFFYILFICIQYRGFYLKKKLPTAYKGEEMRGEKCKLLDKKEKQYM